MRVQEHPIRFRVTENMHEAIIGFAERNGIYNAEGEPNISGAVRMLVGIALDSGDGQSIAASAYESARSQLLNRLTKSISEAFSDLADKL